MPRTDAVTQIRRNEGEVITGAESPPASTSDGFEIVDAADNHRRHLAPV